MAQAAFISFSHQVKVMLTKWFIADHDWQIQTLMRSELLPDPNQRY